eukprot:gene4134-5888_t
MSNLSVDRRDPRQIELEKLQNEYRNMESNRRAYAEESQALLRKQQVTIDKLRKDNESIKNEIGMIMRSSNKPMSTNQLEIIQQLNEQGDKYAMSIETEKKNIQIMEEQIYIMKQKILQQRRAMGGVNASKENHFMIQKQIRILENRLEKALIRFNEAISHNKSLRDNIDDLRRERVVFENIYRKMERELQERKKLMAEIIETSNQAYEQRDTYQMEIAAIEQANRKEHEEFEEQMQVLSQILDYELKLPTTSLGSSRKAVGSRSSGNIKSTNSLDENKEFSKSKSLGATGNTNNNEDGINFKERAQNFEEAFNKIKSATGITDIDELVRTFIKNEEHNFSLFNYVNEQNNEIEKYEEQIQALREEEMKFAQESGNDVNQHKQILKDLETKLQTSDSMAEKYESRCQDLQRILESLKRGMQSIFSKFDFEGDDIGDAVVTDSNMVNYLGIIEKKANQLLQNYSAVRSSLLGTNSPGKNTMKTNAPAEKFKQITSDAYNESVDLSQSLVTVLGSGPKVPMGQELLHVNPPKADDYNHNSDEEEDEDDMDMRPLTREELKSRTLTKLQRKAQNGYGASNNANGGATGATSKASKKKNAIKK